MNNICKFNKASNKPAINNFAELIEVLGKPSNVIQCIPPETGILTFRMLKWNEQDDETKPTLIVTHHIIEDTWDINFFDHDWGSKNNMHEKLSHVSLDVLNNWIVQNAELIIEKMRR
jgi:hypothetical protein